MTTFRTPERKNWFILERNAIEDKALSYKAIGIHTYLLSKPDNWLTIITDLVNRHTDGRDSVRAGLNELIDAGYLVRTTNREDGKFVSVEYDVLEQPLSREEVISRRGAEKPFTENPITVNPTTVNPTLVSIDTSKDSILVSNDKQPPSEGGGKVFKLWEENMPGTFGPILIEKIQSLIDETSEESVVEGIKIAVANNKRFYNYVQACATRHANGDSAPGKEEMKRKEYAAVPIVSREGWTAPDREPTVFAHIRESSTWQCDWDKDSRVVHIRTRLQPELAEMRLARNVATALHTDPAYADWSYQFEAV